MSSPTKIIVLHMKEIIYTIILIALILIFIILFSTMFLSSRKETSAKKQTYTPGVYTSTLTLNNTDLELEVTVDKTHINSITFSHLDDTVATMYPLIEPTMEDISKQVCKKQSLENLKISEDNAYTSKVLVQAIQQALKKAAVQ